MDAEDGRARPRLAGLARAAAGLDLRLVALDIDGTCMDEAGQVSAAVRRALRRVEARGLALAVATGRTHQAALEFHGLTGSPLPLISYNGALVKERAGPVQRRWPLDAAVVEAALELLEREPWRGRVVAQAHASAEIFASRLSPTAQAMAARRGMQVDVVDDLAALAGRGFEQLNLLARERRPLAELRTALIRRFDGSRLYASSTITLGAGGQLLILSSPRADKAHALRYLAEEVMGLRADQVMAIGDGLNDLGMLCYAGLGVAMGQAPAPVKAVADAIAPSVDADGAALALEAALANA